MAMEYKIYNFGQTREIPYYPKPIELLQNTSVTTKDSELAKYLGRFPQISVKEIEPDKYEGLELKDLLTKASEKGLTGFFGKTKDVLLGLLRRHDIINMEE